MNKTWYVEYGLDGREPVGSSDGLLFVLDRLSRAHRPLAASIVSPSGKTLMLGVGREESVVLYQVSADPPYFHSVGDRRRQGVTTFRYGGEETEFPRASAVDKEVALRAALEFFATDERPECLQWEED